MRSRCRESKSVPARSRSRGPRGADRRAVSQDREHSASSSSDDVRSFCDSISHMAGKLSRSLSFFGWQPTTPIVTQPHPIPATSARYSNIVGLEKTYVESATVPQTLPPMTVKFESERDVQELTFFGANVCMEKQAKRGSKNPWRQYGALRKLHEIGGNAPERMDKKSRKKGSSYIKIKKGSLPPNPPITPEVVLNGGRDVTILRGLKLPSGVPAEQLALSVAMEMQRIARESLAEETSNDGEAIVAMPGGLVLNKTK